MEKFRFTLDVILSLKIFKYYKLKQDERSLKNQDWIRFRRKSAVPTRCCRSGWAFSVL